MDMYMDRINRTKGPIVMFMGHIGVPTKEVCQRGCPAEIGGMG
jgi:hypothetical protein